MKFSLILVVGLIASLHAHADTFVWQTVDNEKTINCFAICSDFERQDKVDFQLVPLGVTMTGGFFTAVYTNLQHGGTCVATRWRKVPFFIKAHQGVRLIDEKFVLDNAQKCPNQGIWLDPDYFGDITDARQVVLFDRNTINPNWHAGRKFEFVRKDAAQFESLSNSDKEFVELHIP